MNQLASMLKWEFILQSRYKIIHISLVSVVLYYVCLQAIPLMNTTGFRTILLAFDPILIGIMFVGALVLFEKTENTLQALTITPLKRRNYFLSKIISLTVLSLITAVLFVVLAHGLEFNYFYMVIGVVLSSIFLILVGFIIVSRCHSINEYLMMMMFSFLILFIPPMLHISGLYENSVFYLWPSQAVFILMKGIMASISPVEAVYAISYLILWIFFCYSLSTKAFYKHIVLGG